jgi:hypothetical protein
VAAALLSPAISPPTAAAAVAGSAQATSSSAATDIGALKMIDGRYLITLSGNQAADGGFAADAALSTVKTLIVSAGGQLVADMSKQIGVVVADSRSPAFASTLATSPLIDSVGNDFGVKMYASDAPEPSADPLEALQWDMQQIRTEQAHQTQAGIAAVDVGVLDSGIDGRHPDFLKAGVSNVDCARGRDSLASLPPGVAVGTPDPCTDNQFHGTHVAGTIGARANGVGIVGVAPNVTLVPVKVCDATGFCYASPVVDGITYAGDQQFDVINMSFFVDDNAFQESHEFKCSSDPTQRTFRQAVERAISYARNRGVTPVAALGNSDQDLAHPVDEDGQPISDDCEVVPAETQGHGPRRAQREGRLLQLRRRHDRRRRPGRQRHHWRLQDHHPLHLPGWRLRLHPGHLDGIAARRGCGCPDRQPVRPHRHRRRREALATDRGELPAGHHRRSRAARVRRVLRQRPHRRRPGGHPRHLRHQRPGGPFLP